MTRAPEGRKRNRAGRMRSFVPGGTRFIFVPLPSDESLDYFRASLRDVKTRHAKRVPGFQPAVEPGILPGGSSRGFRSRFRVQSSHSGRQDAVLYGSQDGRRYSRKSTPITYPGELDRESDCVQPASLLTSPTGEKSFSPPRGRHPDLGPVERLFPNQFQCRLRLRNDRCG